MNFENRIAENRIERIEIRSERIEDFPAIAEIHALAFTHSQGMGEVAMVDAHRHRKGYDSHFSLVATLDGDVVGHVLFTRWRVLVGGHACDAAILSPIAVHPAVQKLGIGARLIEEGHHRLREAECAFSMLLGHPEYYPRFGYQMNMYGSCSVLVSRNDTPNGNRSLVERRVQADDIPHLLNLWQTWFHDVDLSIMPGDAMTDWISPDKGTTSSVVCDPESGERLGYVRYTSSAPQNISSFLAKDADAWVAMVDFMNRKSANAGGNQLVLPIHPLSHAAKTLVRLPYETRIQSWKAGMIKVLQPENEFISSYCRDVSAAERSIGLVIWPVAFDVCS